MSLSFTRAVGTAVAGAWLMSAGWLGTQGAMAQTIVSTLPNVDVALGSIGEGRAFQSIGQTFLLPASAGRLDAFEYILQRGGGAGNLPFRTYVMEWDAANQRAVGAPLYRSGRLFYDLNRSAQRFRLPTGKLQLNPTKQYVGFISTAEVSNGTTDREMFLHAAGWSSPVDAYVPGSMVFQSSGTSFANVTSAAWASFNGPRGAPPVDLGFRAFFDMPYDPNLLQGMSPSLIGAFGNAGLASTLTDGLYLTEGTQWQTGTVWWTNPGNEVLFDLGHRSSVTGLNLQADDNDAYIIEARAGINDPWTLVHVTSNLVGIGGGMRTRPDPGNSGGRFFLPETLDARWFRVRGDITSGDSLFSLSEFQVYAAVPEPSSVALLIGVGVAAASLALRGRRRRSGR